MAIDRKLLARAQRNPSGLRFGELVQLVASAGFVHDRTVGSHLIFRHPDAARLRGQFPRPLTLQPRQGRAKPYQVRQVLEMCRALGIIEEWMADIQIPHYAYEVFWSAEDGEYVARCREFPHVSALEATPARAVEELEVALGGVLAMMQEQGDPWPEPLPAPAQSVAKTG